MRPNASARAIDEQGWGSWCELTVVYPNRGFCGGNNLVIRPVLESDDPPEYMLLLNADTVVLEHALDTLVEFMDNHPKSASPAASSSHRTGRSRASPFVFMGISSELDRGLQLGIVSKLLSDGLTMPPTPAVACAADWVSGASMILRTIDA